MSLFGFAVWSLGPRVFRSVGWIPPPSSFRNPENLPFRAIVSVLRSVQWHWDDKDSVRSFSESLLNKKPIQTMYRMYICTTILPSSHQVEKNVLFLTCNLVTTWSMVCICIYYCRKKRTLVLSHVVLLIRQISSSQPPPAVGALSDKIWTKNQNLGTAKIWIWAYVLFSTNQS